MHLNITQKSSKNFDKLIDRPIFLGLVSLIIIVLVWGVLRRQKLEYA